MISRKSSTMNTVSHQPSTIYPDQVVARTVELTKIFGTHVAVDSVDLEIRTGEVLGFLGPNGAGKTTTINMILGLLQPTSGHVELFGDKAHWTQSEMRRRIGALLDGVELYPYLSARESLRVFSGVLRGIPERRIDEVLDTVDLTSRANDKVHGFSQGMKRRLGLALSLLPDPDILILDEPANGLDPEGIKDLRDLLKGLANAGKGIFLSSHLLHEVEIICDRVIILRKGKVIAQGRVDELIKQTPTIELAVNLPEEAEKILLAEPNVSSVNRTGNRLTVQYIPYNEHVDLSLAIRPDLERDERNDHASAAVSYERSLRMLAQQLNKSLASHGIFAYKLTPRRSNLEDAFFNVLKKVE